MKKITLIIVALAMTFSAQAQLYGYKWRVGVSAGTTNYYGDIRPFELDNFKNFLKLYQHNSNYSEKLSYQVSLEYALGKSVGIMLTGGTYQFGSGDRYVQKNNTLLVGNTNFDRALNFQTELYDAGLSFVFKPDNNWLLSGKSFLAPYLTLGFGVQQFKVYGDLMDASGSRYDYSNPGVIPDGTFETNLSKLNTEKPEGYDQQVFYANLGLGLRFRITKNLEIFAQSDFKRAATDYLDDVSGVYRSAYDNSLQAYAAKPGTNAVTAENPYRGMKNGNPDWYIYHGIGLKFSFGANKKTFTPPIISQRYTYEPVTELPEIIEEDSVKKDSVVHVPMDPFPQNQNIVNNYFTVVRLPGNHKGTAEPVIDSVELAKVRVLKDSLLVQRDSLNLAYQKNESKLANVNTAFGLSELDSTETGEVDSIRVKAVQVEQANLDSSKIDITYKLKENRAQLDSLDKVLVKLGTAAYAPGGIDTTVVMQELVIYPGQVSRILFNTNPAILSLDTADRKVYNSVSPDTSGTIAAPDTIAAPPNTSDTIAPPDTSRADLSPDVMTREQLDDEIEQLRSEMAAGQAQRDSVLLNELASINQANLSEVLSRVGQQEIPVTYNVPDNQRDGLFSGLFGNDNSQEKKENRLLKDALLVGGAAATTAAITTGGNKKKREAVAAAVASNDSTLLARIAMDSVIIDSLSNLKPQVVVDTVKLIEEKKVKTYFDQSKIEVYFAINESDLSAKELAKLDPVATYMSNNPEVELELVGFADNTGSIAYNLTLTQKRVDSVRNTLIEKYNIDPNRITQGDGGLIIRGKTKGSVESDRKVEIRILKN